uniref:Serine protease K12H4.7 n=1 Tax=Syphacia muris TaxID=451379 RepID=A0A0N5AGL3_9BILA
LSVRRKWLLGNRGHFNFIAKKIFRSKRISKISVQRFKQRVDHFDASNTQTFNQRYWYTNKYYKPGGPIFLMIEGESEASPSWLEYESIPFLKMVKNNSALAFVLEHRYYGGSQPFEDLSTEHLKYLSSRQAIEDIADFIRAMNQSFKLENPKWITFGGSYSGALSAWMRETHPELVYGAIATSGPVLAQVNFPEYMEAVANAISEHSQICAMNLQLGLKAAVELMKTKEGRSKLKSMFYLCDSLEGLTENGIATFYESILGNYMSAAQYGGDNAVMRSWVWQTCTEFGYYQTTQSTKATKFFGDLVIDISFTGTAHCADMYEESSDDLESLKKGRTIIAESVKTWVNAK